MKCHDCDDAADGAIDGVPFCPPCELARHTHPIAAPQIGCVECNRLGWAVFNADEGIGDIQRCDTCQTLDSDDAAAALAGAMVGAASCIELKRVCAPVQAAELRRAAVILAYRVDAVIATWGTPTAAERRSSAVRFRFARGVG